MTGPELETVYLQARSLMRDRRALEAIKALTPLLRVEPADPRVWQLYGFALREEQRMAEAIEAFQRATTLAPGDALTATAVAQTALQCGHEAVASSRRALEIAPGNLSLLLTLAGALVAAGERAIADEVLARELAQKPGWLEGQQSLAELRWTGGDGAGFARAYEAGCSAEPGNLRLRLAWFRSVAQARDWEAARRIVADGIERFGEVPALMVARTFLAAESGATAEAEALFERTRGLADEVRDLAWIRHCLRARRAAEAEPEALRLSRTASAGVAWPYLSLIWRVLGDPRAAWLDGDPPYVRALEVGLDAGELEELATLLRELHTARAPYLEQSVRGGTQTERPVLFRTEPIIRKTRERLLEAVRDYVAGLPPAEPGHPLLGTAREHLLFSGSWSVRLLRQGFNVAHTHPLGWLSSAFYVSLPSAAEMGTPPAGRIRFGEAPPELGLDLPAYAEIEPREGRLAMFPSTMWHATVPFDDGERLVLAFDIRRPDF